MSENGIDADELAIALGIAEELTEKRRQLKNLNDGSDNAPQNDEYELGRSGNFNNAPAGSFKEYVNVAMRTPGYFKPYTNKRKRPIFLIYNVCCLDVKFLEKFFDALSDYEKVKS